MAAAAGELPESARSVSASGHHHVGGLRYAFVLLAAACLLALVAVWNGHPFMYADTPTYLRGAEMGATKIVGPNRLPAWVPADRTAPSAGVETRQQQQQQPQPTAAADAHGEDAGVIPMEAVAPAGSISSVEDKIVLAGRSVYYGALLYLSFLAGSLWLTVLVHGLCVAWVLHLVMVRLWRLPTTAFFATLAVLTVASPLAAFTGLLMPDVFAGLSILCIAVLGVYWDRVGRGTRWGLAALLLFSLAGHGSHVALAVLLLAGAFVLRWMGRWQAVSLRGLGVAAACVAGALVAEAAFNLAVTRALGAPPLRLPHLTGRLIDMGPGTDYLRRHCATTKFAACAYVSNYPTEWTAFLFSTDPDKGAFALADAANKRRISEEQLDLAMAVLWHDPVGVLSGIGADIVRQVVLFQVDITGIGTDHLPMYAGRVPESVFEGLQRSRTLDTHAAHDFFTTLTYASVGASLLLAGALAWRRRQAGGGATAHAGPPGFHAFAWVAVAGVLGNAVVCAAFASSFERFQSRVIWIVPFLALSWLALALQHRRTAACQGLVAQPASAPVSPLEGSTP
ncbi:hypothetical protein WG922_11765 [Ramlibacter sp. AN1015]|uniref:hypothetical protein n=1 Tax=Ramlibacter sp. AN1015 TaxID=3133428 RepID=UPI0030BB8909